MEVVSVTLESEMEADNKNNKKKGEVVQYFMFTGANHDYTSMVNRFEP